MFLLRMRWQAGLMGEWNSEWLLANASRACRIYQRGLFSRAVPLGCGRLDAKRHVFVQGTAGDQTAGSSIMTMLLMKGPSHGCIVDLGTMPRQ